MANSLPKNDAVRVSLFHLHTEMRGCRLCEDAGFIDAARPVLSDGGRFGGLILIGQAPGAAEHGLGRPFAGRAGRELFRWLQRIDIAEEDFRRHVYIAAVTRCFPGKSLKGGGDRRPSRREIELCRPWLERQIALIQPRAALLVGGLAIAEFLPPQQPLCDLVGHRYQRDGVVYVPLPHPSGASRWLNAPSQRRLLDGALMHVREVWQCFGVPRSPAMIEQSRESKDRG